MPPSSGNLAESVATASVEGMKKKPAASSHRVMETGPVCAAAANQRMPMTAAMLNNTRSRRPSSRRSWGSVEVFGMEESVAWWGGATGRENVLLDRVFLEWSGSAMKPPGKISRPGDAPGGPQVARHALMHHLLMGGTYIFAVEADYIRPLFSALGCGLGLPRHQAR